MGIVSDLAGQVFGRLTVMAANGTVGRYVAWDCRCACGEMVRVSGQNLRDGSTKSCGCIRKARAPIAARSAGEANKTHGHCTGYRRTPSYITWRAMLKRCYDEKSESYQYYGARGITVCDRWRKFEDFLVDMGPRPAGTSIDRIDPNGNYEAPNCRWATCIEQRKNRRA